MIRIFLTGYMGAGKTTLGKAFARELNVPFIDLDWYIEDVFTNPSVNCSSSGERPLFVNWSGICCTRCPSLRMSLSRPAAARPVSSTIWTT